MGDRISKRAIALGQSLTLWGAANRVVVLRHPAVIWHRRHDGRCQIALSFLVSHDDFRRIAGMQIFSLYPELCGATFGGALLRNRAVAIDVALSADLCARFAGAQDVRSVAAAIRDATREDPIRIADNYFATHVKQTLVPGVMRGFSTRWAAEFGFLRSD